VQFVIEGRDEPVTVYTTRPDTLYGATFFVVAADSDLAAELAAGTEAEAEFAEYLAQVKQETEIDRMARPAEDRRVPQPVRDQPGQRRAMPVFASDYVLADYGTGAIMAVPAHDQRDLDFARTFDLPCAWSSTPP
jgi:leucyl-tRNA synthetase